MTKKPDKSKKILSNYLENELESLRAMLKRLFKKSQSEPDEKSVHEKNKDIPADEEKKSSTKD